MGLLFLRLPLLRDLSFTDFLTYSATGASTRLTDVRRCSASIAGLVVAVSAAGTDVAAIRRLRRAAWNRRARKKKIIIFNSLGLFFDSAVLFLIIIQQVVLEPGNNYNFLVLSTAPTTHRTSQYSRSARIVEFRRSGQGNPLNYSYFPLKHVDSKN
ncbi:hypothetical protein M9H77_30584 [Catharanthus roseus]|uniref:Uncharacterized protein n=1 Tax=Catharanthus roseus TaxID=4058 RepID=A0ACB9ZXQ1_CATRO|nr:hypothetical protein M9H77_30584 [Catharanthus roseus]